MVSVREACRTPNIFVLEGESSLEERHMIHGFVKRVRGWLTVEDAENRIEGSGEAITSPQHRRSPEAEAELERLQEAAEETERT